MKKMFLCYKYFKTRKKQQQQKQKEHVSRYLIQKQINK